MIILEKPLEKIFPRNGKINGKEISMSKKFLTLIGLSVILLVSSLYINDRFGDNEKVNNWIDSHYAYNLPEGYESFKWELTPSGKLITKTPLPEEDLKRDCGDCHIQ
jgi:hypothetical protein